ncbi:hypothetical protein SPRG_22259, partial [Saprolegnia parasitica CBS 223.65]
PYVVGSVLFSVQALVTQSTLQPLVVTLHSSIASGYAALFDVSCSLPVGSETFSITLSLPSAYCDAVSMVYMFDRLVNAAEDGCSYVLQDGTGRTSWATWFSGTVFLRVAPGFSGNMTLQYTATSGNVVGSTAQTIASVSLVWDADTDPVVLPGTFQWLEAYQNELIFRDWKADVEDVLNSAGETLHGNASVHFECDHLNRGITGGWASGAWMPCDIEALQDVYDVALAPALDFSGRTAVTLVVTEARYLARPIQCVIQYTIRIIEVAPLPALTLPVTFQPHSVIAYGQPAMIALAEPVASSSSLDLDILVDATTLLYEATQPPRSQARAIATDTFVFQPDISPIVYTTVKSPLLAVACLQGEPATLNLTYLGASNTTLWVMVVPRDVPLQINRASAATLDPVKLPPTQLLHVQPPAYFTGRLQFDIRIGLQRGQRTAIVPYAAVVDVTPLPVPPVPRVVFCNRSVPFGDVAVVTMTNVPLSTTTAFAIEIEVLNATMASSLIAAQVVALETISHFPAQYHYANVTSATAWKWTLPVVLLPSGTVADRHLVSLSVAVHMAPDFAGHVPLALRLVSFLAANASVTAEWVYHQTVQWHYNQVPLVEVAPLWTLTTLENLDTRVAWMALLTQSSLIGTYWTQAYNLTGVSLQYGVNKTVRDASIDTFFNATQSATVVRASKLLAWSLNDSMSEITSDDAMQLYVLPYRYGSTNVTLNFTFHGADESIRPRILMQPIQLDVLQVAQVPVIDSVRSPAVVASDDIADVTVQIATPILDGSDMLTALLWTDSPSVAVQNAANVVLVPHQNETLPRYGIPFGTSFYQSIQTWSATFRVMALGSFSGKANFCLEIRAIATTNTTSRASVFHRFAIDFEPSDTPIVVPASVVSMAVFGGEIWTLDAPAILRQTNAQLPLPYATAAIASASYEYTLETANIHYGFASVVPRVLAPVRVALNVAGVPPLTHDLVHMEAANTSTYDQPITITLTLQCAKAVVHFEPTTLAYLVNGRSVQDTSVLNMGQPIQVVAWPPLGSNFSGVIPFQVSALCDHGPALSVRKDLQWLANPASFLLPPTTANASTNENTWLQMALGSMLSATNRTVNDIRYRVAALRYVTPLDDNIQQVELGNATLLDSNYIGLLPRVHFSGVLSVTWLVEYEGVGTQFGQVVALQNQTATHTMLVAVHPVAVAPTLDLATDGVVDFGNYSRATLHVTIGGDTSQTTQLYLACTGSIVAFSGGRWLPYFGSVQIGTLNLNTTLQWIYAPSQAAAGTADCTLHSMTTSVDLGLGTDPRQMLATQSVNWTATWQPSVHVPVMPVQTLSFTTMVNRTLVLSLPDLISSLPNATSCALQWYTSDVQRTLADGVVVNATRTSQLTPAFAQASGMSCANLSQLTVEFASSYVGRTTLFLGVETLVAQYPVAIAVTVKSLPVAPHVLLSTNAVVASYEQPVSVVAYAPAPPGTLVTYHVVSSPPIITAIGRSGEWFTADVYGIISMRPWAAVDATLQVAAPIGYVGSVLLTITALVQNGADGASDAQQLNATWLRALPPSLQVSSVDSMYATDVASIQLQTELQHQDSAIGALSVLMTTSHALQDVTRTLQASPAAYHVQLPTNELLVTPLRYFGGPIVWTFQATSTAFGTSAISVASLNMTVVPVVSTPNITLGVPAMVQNTSSRMSIQVALVEPLGYTEVSKSTLVFSSFGIDAITDASTNASVPCVVVGPNVTACPLATTFGAARNFSLVLTPYLDYAGPVNFSVLTIHSILEAPLGCMESAWNSSMLHACCENVTSQCTASSSAATIVVRGIAAYPNVSVSPISLVSSVQAISAVKVLALDVHDPFHSQLLTATIVCPLNTLHRVVVSQNYTRTNMTKLTSVNASSMDMFSVAWLPRIAPWGLELEWSANATTPRFNCTLVAQSRSVLFPNSTATTNTTFFVELNLTPPALTLSQAYIEVQEGQPIVLAAALATANATLVLEAPLAVIQRVAFQNASMLYATTTQIGNRTFVYGGASGIRGSFVLTTFPTSGDVTLRLYSFPTIASAMTILNATSAARVLVHINPIPMLPLFLASPSVLFVPTSMNNVTTNVVVSMAHVDVDNVVYLQVGVPRFLVTDLSWNGQLQVPQSINTTSTLTSGTMTLAVQSYYDGHFAVTLDAFSVVPALGLTASNRSFLSVVAFASTLDLTNLVVASSVEGGATDFIEIPVTSNVSDLVLLDLEQHHLGTVVANGIVLTRTDWGNSSIPSYALPQPLMQLHVRSRPGFAGFFTVALAGVDTSLALGIAPVRVHVQPVALPPQLLKVSPTIINGTTVYLDVVSDVPSPSNGVDVLTLTMTLPVYVPVIACSVPSRASIPVRVNGTFRTFDVPSTTTTVRFVLAPNYVGTFSVAVLLTDTSGLVSTASVETMINLVIAPRTAPPAVGWTYALSSQVPSISVVENALNTPSLLNATSLLNGSSAWNASGNVDVSSAFSIATLPSTATHPLQSSITFNGSETWLAFVPTVSVTDLSDLEISSDVPRLLSSRIVPSKYFDGYVVLAPHLVWTTPYTYGAMTTLLGATTASLHQATGVSLQTTSQSSRVVAVAVRITPVAQVPTVTLQLPPPIAGFGPWAVYEADAVNFTINATTVYAVPTQVLHTRLSASSTQLTSISINGTVLALPKVGPVVFPSTLPANVLPVTTVSLPVVRGVFGLLPMQLMVQNTETLNNDSQLVVKTWNVTVVPVAHVPTLVLQPSATTLRESDVLQLTATATVLSTTENISISVASWPTEAAVTLQHRDATLSHLPSGALVTLSLAKYWSGTLQLNVTALAQQSMASPRDKASTSQLLNITVLPVAYPPLLVVDPSKHGVMGTWVTVPINVSALVVRRSSDIDEWSLHLVARAGALSVWANQTLLTRNASLSNITLDIFSLPVSGEHEPRRHHKDKRDNGAAIDLFIAGIHVSANATAMDQGTSVLFTVAVNSPPIAPVTITLACNDTSRLIVPAPLVATTNTTLQWLLRSTRDFMDNGNNVVNCAMVINTTDVYYQQVPLPNTSLVLVNKDTSGFALRGTMLNNRVQLTVAEGGFPDSYTVALTSKPFDEVDIFMTSNVSYLRTTPPLLVFTQDNWNVPQTVVANASKESNIIGMAPAFILHTIVTNDTKYAALQNFTVGVSLLVTSDTTPPPALQSAQFGNTGADILLTFSRDVDLSSFPTPTSFVCTRLLVFTTGFYGDVPTCGWTSKSTVRILLGQSPTVLPGDKCQVVAGLKATATSTLSMPTSYIVIQTPVNPPVPKVSVTGPQNLGSCDDLVLDGRSSSGGGGRAMAWVWTVTNAPDIAATLSALGTTAQTVSLPASTLIAGGTYTFSLTITNFFGAFGTSGSIVVTKASTPLPVVSIDGPSAVSLTKASTLALNSVATPATCGNTDVSSIALSFQWSMLGSSGVMTVVNSTSRNPRQLRLPLRTIAYGTYTVQVLVGVVGHPAQINSASVTLQVVPSALVAVISNGFRSVGNQADLVLSGTASNDPDSSSTTLLYAWQCFDAMTGAVSCGNVSINNGSTSTVAKTNLPPTTTIRILLTVYDPVTQRSAQASTTYTVLLGSPPKTTVAPLSQLKYNPDVKIVLNGAVTSAIDSSPTTLWSVQGDATVADTAFGFARTSKRMLLLPNTLTAGKTYVFVFTGTDKFGQSSNATISVQINEPPTSGLLVSSPTSGTTLATPFAVSCLNWVDVDLPLTYAFKYIVGPASADATEIALGDYALSTAFTTIFPLGGGVNSTITIVAYVADAYGYATKVYTEIVVAAPTGSASAQQAALSDQSSQLVASAASTDPGQVVNLVGMLASTLNAPPATTTSSGSSSGGSTTTPAPTASVAPGRTPKPTAVVLKSCPSLSAALVCSGHGACVLNPPKCPATNIDCTATCTCEPSWYDSDCATPQGYYDQKQAMLGNLLTAMASATSSIEPTAKAVEQQTSAVQSITANSGLLSPTQQTQALDLVAGVLSASSQVQLSTAATTAVGRSISNLLDAPSTTKSGPRRLSETTNSTADAAAKAIKIQSTVGLLASAMLNGIVPGEDPVEMNSKNVKMVLQRHDPANLQGTLELPLSESQVQANYSKQTFTLPTTLPASSACAQGVDTHATFLAQNVYQYANASSNINSGIIGLKLLCDDSSTPLAVANLTSGISIRMRKLAQYPVPGAPTSGNVSCTAGPPVHFNITCDIDQQLYKLVACNGSANYTVQYTCPQYIPTPKCQYWDTTAGAWSTAGCRQEPDPDDNYMLCVCDHLTDFSTQVDMAFQAVEDNFFSVIEHQTTVEDVVQNIGIVITMGVMVILYGVSLLFCLKWDRDDRAKRRKYALTKQNEPTHIDLRSLFVLPKVAAAKTRRAKAQALLSGFWDGLKAKHRILSTILRYDETFTRPQRAMVIFTVTMSQMLINALLYKLRQMDTSVATVIVSGLVSSVCLMPVTLAFVILFRKAGKMHDYTVRYEIEDDDRIVEVEVDAYGKPVQYSQYDMLCIDLQGLLNAVPHGAYARMLARLERDGNLTSLASIVSQSLYLILHNREVREPDPLDDIAVELVSKNLSTAAQPRFSLFAKPKVLSMAIETHVDAPVGADPGLLSVESAVAKLLALWSPTTDVYGRLNKFEPTAITSSTRSKLGYLLQEAIELQKKETSTAEVDELASVASILAWCRKCYECAECFANDTNAVLRHAKHEMQRTREQLVMTRRMVQKQLRDRLQKFRTNVVRRSVDHQVQVVIQKSKHHMTETRRRLQDARRKSRVARKLQTKEVKKQMAAVLGSLHGLTRWKKRFELYEEAKEKRLADAMPLHERQRYLNESEKLKKLRFGARLMYNLFLRKAPQRLEKPIFPEFVNYILYAVCAGIDAFAAYFVLQFSFTVGHAVASMWIGSLFTGLAMTYLVSEPVHIFLRVGVLPLLASIFLVNTGLFEALGTEIVTVGAAAAVGIAGVAKFREKKAARLLPVSVADGPSAQLASADAPPVLASAPSTRLVQTSVSAPLPSEPAPVVPEPVAPVAAGPPTTSLESPVAPRRKSLVEGDTTEPIASFPTLTKVIVVSPRPAPSRGASTAMLVTGPSVAALPVMAQETTSDATSSVRAADPVDVAAALTTELATPPPAVDEFVCECGASTPQDARAHHLEHDCTHRLVQCRAGCGIYIQLRARSSHEMSQCRLLLCACGKMVLRTKMASHLESECVQRSVTCRLGCGASMPLHAREKHERSVCDLRVTSCPDCNTVLPVRELATHRAACTTKAIVRGPATKLLVRRQSSLLILGDDVLAEPSNERPVSPPSPTTTSLQGPPLVIPTVKAPRGPLAAPTTTNVARRARAPPAAAAAPGEMQGPPLVLAPGAMADEAKAKNELARKGVAMAAAADGAKRLTNESDAKPRRADVSEAVVETTGAGQMAKSAFEGAAATLFDGTAPVRTQPLRGPRAANPFQPPPDAKPST